MITDAYCHCRLPTRQMLEIVRTKNGGQIFYCAGCHKVKVCRQEWSTTVESKEPLNHWPNTKHRLRLDWLRRYKSP